MPRDLSEVLHYFLPELGTPPPAPALPARPERAERAPGLPLSILGVPLGERDLVHAACAWNLAVETARQGGMSVIVLPRGETASPLAPPGDAAAQGVEVVEAPVRDPGGLGGFARRLAGERGRSARDGGIVFVWIPGAWLEGPDSFDEAVRWFLLFATPGERGERLAFDRAKRLAERSRGAEIGIALHGVRDAREARTSFEALADHCQRQLGLALVRYGICVDDLDLYRAIAAGRAVSSACPESAGARSLARIAGQLYEDARSRILG